MCPGRAGHRTAIAYRHLDRIVPQCPRDLHVCTGKRSCVPDGIAEKLTHDENRIADGRLEDPGGAQVGRNPLTGDSDACWCPGQQYRPRRSHLPR
jgi:hypothetical protein